MQLRLVLVLFSKCCLTDQQPVANAGTTVNVGHGAWYNERQLDHPYDRLAGADVCLDCAGRLCISSCSTGEQLTDACHRHLSLLCIAPKYICTFYHDRLHIFSVHCIAKCSQVNIRAYNIRAAGPAGAWIQSWYSCVKPTWHGIADLQCTSSSLHILMQQVP